MKKLAVLILIVCLVRLPVFAGDYDEETSTAAALLASGETWLIVLGGVLVVAILVAVGVTAMAKADEPSDGLYLVSDNNQIIKQVQKKLYIQPSHQLSIIDFQRLTVARLLSASGLIFNSVWRLILFYGK